MIALASDSLFQLGPVPITNTLVDTLFVDVAVFGIAAYINKRASVIPSFFQSMVELIVEAFYGLTQSTAGKHTAKIFPYVMTFFTFILVANLSELVPVISSFGFYHGHELTPLIRSTSSDLNTTLALALVSLSATHIMSIRTLGIKKYLGRFFSLN